MKIAIFGSGYVGLVTGACLADVGNQVIGIDTDLEKVKLLNAGISPIYEPGLSEVLKKNQHNGQLFFTTDAKEAIEKSEIIFIAVGTPAQKDGAVSLEYIDQVAVALGQFLNEYKGHL